MDAIRQRLHSIGLQYKHIDAMIDEAWEWDALLELHHCELMEVAEEAGLDEESKHRFIDYVLQFSGPLSRPEVLVDAALQPGTDIHHAGSDERDHAAVDAPAPVLAIATMTKQPIDFIGWLRHHRDEVGVQHFFVRVEETPELAAVLAAPEWRSCVHATFAAGETDRDNGGAQCARQDAHVQWAIVEARRHGCTHLLHCDDDELFFAPGGKARLHAFLRYPPRPGAAGNAPLTCCIVEHHARVMEALYPSCACAGSPFASAVAFRHRPSQMARYGWQRGATGKSIGVLAVADLCPAGPHHFRQLPRSERATGGEPLPPHHAGTQLHLQNTVIFPADLCVLLHFESPTIERWIDKYAGRRTDKTDKGESVDDAAAGEAQRQLMGKPSCCTEDVKRRLLEEGDAKMAQGRARTYDYFCESSAAAQLFRDAIKSADADAVREARAVCEHVWSRWKLQPHDMPLALEPSERFHVLRDRGITILKLRAGVGTEHDDEAGIKLTGREPTSSTKITVGARLRAKLEEQQQAHMRARQETMQNHKSS